MKTFLKPIRSSSDYDAAQRRAATLLLKAPPLGSPLGDELEILGILIAAYDREHFPVGPADPIAAIAFAVDQRGWEPKDLIPYLGTRSRVSEVMQGKRRLSLGQISRLHTGLGIPLACLMAPVPTETANKPVKVSPRSRVPVRRSRSTRGRVVVTHD